MINKIKKIVYESFPNHTLRDGRPLTDLVLKTSAAINEQLEAEKQTFLDKSLLSNHENMTSNEMDMLVSNFLNTKRKVGRFSVGMVRVYLTERVEIVFDQNIASFSDTLGRRFIPRFDFAVSVENLKFDDTNSEYYIDIYVMSEEPFGGEYLVRRGEINNYLGKNPFVKRVANIDDFVLVDIEESNSELYSRITDGGIVLNSTKNNYFGNLIYQNFPDIRKILIVGASDARMKRDLTFDSVDASIAIIEYNFFRKRKSSTIDNKSVLFKGLLLSNEIDELETPANVSSLFTEATQDEYEGVTFKDGSGMSISSLIFEYLFALYESPNDFFGDGWFYSENGRRWNSGSTALSFTNNVNGGLEIKGDYVSEPLLANNDRGLVLYKEFDDIKNSEFILTFQINDFLTTLTPEKIASNEGLDYQVVSNVNEPTALEGGVQTAEANEETITISNNNPLYFTVKKRGIKDQPNNFQSSTYDGYGVAIFKTFPDRRPNVFIIDGSTSTGSMAFEQEILALGSERILAIKEIPLEPSVLYHCVVQINDNYGMNVVLKDEYNTELGRLIVGSGPDLPEYMTTYSSVERIEQAVKSDTEDDIDTPLKFNFISSSDEDEHCSSFLNLSYLLAKDSTDGITPYEYYLKNYGDSKRIVQLDTSAVQNKFKDFGEAEIGDVIEFQKQKFLIVNKYSHKQIEVDKDVPLLPANGVTWDIWKGLTVNIEYTTPNRPFYTNFLILKDGVENIKNSVGTANLNSVVLKYSYIQVNEGFIEDSKSNWTLGNEMKAYLAPEDPTPRTIELDKVLIFDDSLTENTDYFYKASGITKFNSVYLTEAGFNKVKYSNLYIKLIEGATELEFYPNKSEYESGYYLPLTYTSEITSITHLEKLYLKSSGYTFTLNNHYKIFGTILTDVLINPTHYSLFSSLVEFESEVIGTGNYLNVSTVGSTKGSNKIYLTTGAITSTDYYTIIIDGERYFISEITLASTNSPFLGKAIEVIVDKNFTSATNVTVELRKKYINSVSTALMKFGYRYDTPEATGTWIDSTTVDVKYNSQNLIRGEDFEYDRKVPVSYYYISSDVYDGLEETDNIVFKTKYRSIIEESKYLKNLDFSPVSVGSYIGIGFKTVSNSHWNILELKCRKLLERYSGIHLRMYVGNKPVTNEDRLKIEFNSYALNINSTDPQNGVILYVYNASTTIWEKFYENSAATSSEGYKMLHYYDGEDTSKKYNFGYWSGNTFVSVNDTFYPTNYVNTSGVVDFLLVSRGKNERDFSGDILFGEARLFLDYFNLIWQRKAGVHLGNKVDIYVASESQTSLDFVDIDITEATREYSITSTDFTLPIKSIQSITLIPQGLPIGFALENENPVTRFSTNEELKVNFNEIIIPGTYRFTYEYFPHIGVKQSYINSLQSHKDCLIKNFVPIDTTVNIKYTGTIDVEYVKDIIYYYIRFSNSIDIGVLYKIFTDNGATTVSAITGKSPVEIIEYDTEIDTQSFEVYNGYTAKEGKYLDITRNNINIIKDDASNVTARLRWDV